MWTTSMPRYDGDYKAAFDGFIIRFYPQDQTQLCLHKEQRHRG